jgi:hypothetical protein
MIDLLIVLERECLRVVLVRDAGALTFRAFCLSPGAG